MLDAEPDGAGEANRVEDRIRDAERSVRDLLGGTESGSAVTQTIRQANIVEEKFADLQGLVKETEGRPRPVDHLSELLGELYLFVSTVSNKEIGESTRPRLEQGQAIIQELELEAENQPDLVAGLLNAATSRTEDMTFGGALAYLNSLGRSDVLPFCQQAIQGQTPSSKISNVIRINSTSQDSSATTR